MTPEGHRRELPRAHSHTIKHVYHVYLKTGGEMILFMQSLYHANIWILEQYKYSMDFKFFNCMSVFQNTSQKGCAFAEGSLDPQQIVPGSTVPLFPAAQTQQCLPQGIRVPHERERSSSHSPSPRPGLTLQSLRSGLGKGKLWEGLIPRPGSSLCKSRKRKEVNLQGK